MSSSRTRSDLTAEILKIRTPSDPSVGFLESPFRTSDATSSSVAVSHERLTASRNSAARMACLYFSTRRRMWSSLSRARLDLTDKLPVLFTIRRCSGSGASGIAIPSRAWHRSHCPSCVSIHAPARGGATQRARRPQQAARFYPRPREGGDDRALDGRKPHKRFYPRPREGGDITSRAGAKRCSMFLSTPPRGGRLFYSNILTCRAETNASREPAAFFRAPMLPKVRTRRC